jgi:hypothetical protein
MSVNKPFKYVVHRLRHQFHPVGSIALSSSKASSDFSAQRSQYKEKMKKLRQVWLQDIEITRQNEATRRKLERDQIVLKRAKKLRVQRKAAQERQEQVRLFRARMLELYREKLARSHVLEEQRRSCQAEKYAAFLVDLEAEAATWLTEDNIDDLITAELFSKPSTTGLVTSSSRHWKWQAVTFPWGADRTPDPDGDLARRVNTGWEKEKADQVESRSQVRLMIRDMLDEVISDGSQREKLEKYVDEFDEALPITDDSVNRAFGREKPRDIETRRRY